MGYLVSGKVFGKVIRSKNKYQVSMIVNQHLTTRLQLRLIPPRSVRTFGLTLAAYLMGCIQQSDAGNSVIEMHVNLLLH